MLAWLLATPTSSRTEFLGQQQQQLAALALHLLAGRRGDHTRLTNSDIPCTALLCPSLSSNPTYKLSWMPLLLDGFFFFLPSGNFVPRRPVHPRTGKDLTDRPFFGNICLNFTQKLQRIFIEFDYKGRAWVCFPTNRYCRKLNNLCMLCLV